jgi:hypothetical protein
MTRKHYTFIAATVAEMNLLPSQRAHVAGQLANTFAREMPNFDRGRFLEACGVLSSAR